MEFIGFDNGSGAEANARAAARLTRRSLIKRSALTAGCLLSGFHLLDGFAAKHRQSALPALGTSLTLVPFATEGHVDMETLLGAGLDGRLYTDLSAVTPDHPIVPTEKFYVRTRASELLDDAAVRHIAVRIPGNVPRKLKVDDLRAKARPQGSHLVECSGNTRTAHFGMLSVGEWSGVHLAEILSEFRVPARAPRILVAGFDRYPVPSSSSIEGASWIFTQEHLESANAFLAFEMNGQPLTKDHGAPVRLVVPGWYGCTCIKWVNEIAFVAEDAPATSQMMEFASRTHQQGKPELARDFRPARIQLGVLPTRIEKWSDGEKIAYRVVGIVWGGTQPVKSLEIRFNPEEDYVPVSDFAPSSVGPWSFWSHRWMPKLPGMYTIRLRVKEPAVSSIRLDSGFFARSVEIDEV